MIEQPFALKVPSETTCYTTYVEALAFQRRRRRCDLHPQVCALQKKSGGSASASNTTNGNTYASMYGRREYRYLGQEKSSFEDASGLGANTFAWLRHVRVVFRQHGPQQQQQQQRFSSIVLTETGRSDENVETYPEARSVAMHSMCSPSTASGSNDSDERQRQDRAPRAHFGDANSSRRSPSPYFPEQCVMHIPRQSLDG